MEALSRIKQLFAFAGRDQLTRKKNDTATQSGAGRTPAGAKSRFKLVPFFTFASLGILGLVALVLVYQEVEQGHYLVQTQETQAQFFSEAQTAFAKQQEEAARRDLLTIHENGNVNLTRLFANALWDRDFAPFVAKVSRIPVEQCRAIADVKDKAGKAVAPPEKKACYAGVARKIMALPEFKGIDAKVLDSMKKSTVFKIKVFDIRGITAYSSEHAQVGEDKSFNAGWKSAMAGKPASELTHRDTFSAFEGVVENRDLIGSYLPVLAPGTEKIVGVFEVYSDVTPFLSQISRTAAQIKQTAAANQLKVEQAAKQAQKKAEQDSIMGVITVLALFVLLFIALFLIVRRAASIIARQEKDSEQAQQQLIQSEKMAALGQMVAGVAHQLNTPLAFSQSNVQLVMDQLGTMEVPLLVASKFSQIVKSTPGNSVVINLSSARKHVEAVDVVPGDLGMMRDMLKDVLDGISQMSELVVHMRDFTRIDRSKVGEVDINRGLRSVVYMAKSVIPNRIQVVENYGELPEITCQASQLNQVFLNLINNASHAIADTGTITVTSSLEGDFVKIAVSDTGTGISPEVLPHIFETYYTTKSVGEGTGIGLTIALDVVRNHGGDIRIETEVGKGTTFSVYLPITTTPAFAEAA